MPASHRFSTRRAALATFAALVLAANAPALAQAPAGGAVKFILPNAAGSGVDTIVRAITASVPPGMEAADSSPS